MGGAAVRSDVQCTRRNVGAVRRRNVLGRCSTQSRPAGSNKFALRWETKARWEPKRTRRCTAVAVQKSLEVDEPRRTGLDGVESLEGSAIARETEES